ncbi:POK18 protein, partial [Rhynochetos jubatus]|nr:POK18 protein [Rhynochetos jubatus]
PWKYLGWKLVESSVTLQPLRVVTDIKTLNDLQRLLGTVTWVRQYLGISTEDLAPLF